MRRPWHLWAVGVLSLLWNAMGAFDYLMVQARVQAYLEAFTPEQLAYFTSYPTWAVATWATGVWFSVLGSLLLLVCSRFASTAFLISLLGLVATSVYSFGLSEVSMIDLAGPTAAIFSAAIFVMIVVFWAYARAMTRRGYLR